MKIKIEHPSRAIYLIAIVILAIGLVPKQRTLGVRFPAEQGTVLTVNTGGDAGPGTLRQAIIDANAATGPDTINFSIGSGPALITLFSALPEITDPLTIDGTSQPGYSGTPLITLSNSGGPDYGLKITGGQSSVKALVVGTGLNGIVLENGGGNSVTGCIINSHVGNGILINNSSNNVIGSTAAVGGRNIIGSNSNAAIEINGVTSTGNIVIGNYLGVSASGTTQITNGNYGVLINEAPGNRIGGAISGEGNVISGNGQGTMDVLDAGIRILGAGATGNIIQGNFIGTNAAGVGSITNRQHGIRIDGAPNTIVGGSVGTTPGGACTGACNLISGNLRGGITIAGAASANTSIMGNFVGPNAAGSAALNNSGVGILVTDGASNTVIGGTTAAARNVIPNGISLTAGTASNTIQGNYIGTDTTGNVRLGNTLGGAGVLIEDSANNTIGTEFGTTVSGPCGGGCNVISGNNLLGIQIKGPTAAGNRIDYNFIGLNVTGSTVLRNNSDSIDIRNGAHNNIIGRPMPATGVSAPSTSFCIQSDWHGDKVEVDTDTGAYTAEHCNSGQVRTGFGEITKNADGSLSLFGTGIRAVAGPIKGGAVFYSPGSERLRRTVVDSDINNNGNCECPTTAQQRGIGTVISRNDFGQPPPHHNIFHFNSWGWDVSGTVPLASAPDGNFINLSGDNNTYKSLFVAAHGDTPSITVASGNGNFFSDLIEVRVQQPLNISVPSIDLHDDGVTNPPVPNPGPGANHSQNSPQDLSVRLELNGAARIRGSFSGTPNKRFLIKFYIVASEPALTVGSLFFDHSFLTNPPISVEVMTDGDGNAPPLNIPLTGVDPLFLRFAAKVTATATCIDQVPITKQGSVASLVDIFGDTSELSPESIIPDPKFDFDNDGKTDLAVFRPGPALKDFSYWYILNSSDFTFRVVHFGLGEDRPVAGDYQGDGVADFAVYRPSTGTWYHSRLTGDPTTVFESIQWGLPTDIPVPGDYDDDGVNDAAIFRPSDGTWWIRQSLTGPLVQQFGLSTDKPAPADYDGDGSTDIAVYRDGTWYISPCPGCPVRYEHFGLAGDIPVAGDYDGDGRDDVAVWRPSDRVWYLLQSTAGFGAVQWGLSTDIPLSADFDADGKNDIAVWRPSTGDFWWLRSTDGTASVIHWGQNGDIPVPKAVGLP